MGRMSTTALDDRACFAAVLARDPRFDGWFVTAVRTTGIYCRPSCPATPPKRANVAFYPSAAAAQRHGYRACKRCRPDASPGSPAWNGRADVAARAMRLIADGVVDREGVSGLARQLHYSARQVDRLLVAEVGVGPLALARAQRAQTARTLIETTSMPLTEVAFAAGFSSVRQFNDTVRAVFADTPTGLRAHAGARSAPGGGAGRLRLRLPLRRPFDGPALFRFLGALAVPGVEHVAAVDGTPTYTRVLRLPNGPAVVELVAVPGEAHVGCTLRLTDWRDLAAAVARCRGLLDLDADPVAVDDALGRDPDLAPLVAAHPGRRSPGFADGAEGLVLAVVGQQVSVAGARTIAGRLAARHGEPLPAPLVDDAASRAGLRVAFPSPAALAEVDPAELPMPRRRGRAVVELCADLAGGELVVDVGADPDELRRQLVARPGIGPWTADYVTMRALGHPDVLLPTDLGVRRALEATGAVATPRAVVERAAAWRPWRSYAVHHLWGALTAPVPRPPDEPEPA